MRFLSRFVAFVLLLGVCWGSAAQGLLDSMYVNPEFKGALPIGAGGLQPFGVSLGLGLKCYPGFAVELPIEYTVLLNSRDGAATYFSGSGIGLNGVYSFSCPSLARVQVLAGASFLNYSGAGFAAYGVGTRLQGSGELKPFYLSFSGRYHQYMHSEFVSQAVIDQHIGRNFWALSLGFGVYIDAIFDHEIY